MDTAAPRLPVSVQGIVIEGKKMGRRLGFPTANLRMPSEDAHLPFGVYVATVKLSDGRMLKGVLNHGRHPTLPEGQPTVEVHLFDFDEDLYGQSVQVTYLLFLRPEVCFQTKEAMRAQVFEDMEKAKRYFET